MSKFIAYTDGSCDNLSLRRPGGAAYVILDENGQLFKKASKGFLGTTNNRMELLAIVSVVNSLPANSEVTIYTDSRYCIMALNSKKPKKNIDLIRLFHEICDFRITVAFEWVKGHNGVFYNEMCDQMANSEYPKIAWNIKE